MATILHVSMFLCSDTPDFNEQVIHRHRQSLRPAEDKGNLQNLQDGDSRGVELGIRDVNATKTNIAPKSLFSEDVF